MSAWSRIEYQDSNRVLPQLKRWYIECRCTKDHFSKMHLNHVCYQLYVWRMSNSVEFELGRNFLRPVNRLLATTHFNSSPRDRKAFVLFPSLWAISTTLVAG